jgi:rhomboid protease GluP
VNAARIDFERGMPSVPLVATALILVNGAVFLLTAVNGALDGEAGILSSGALSGELVRRGEIWRLLTSMFLHGSAEHLVGNAVGLFILGMAAEHAYGKLEALGVYLVSGLCGAVLSAVANTGTSVGASGAIFGLLGAMIVFFLKHRHDLHRRDMRIGNVLLLWAGYSVVTAFFTPYIDNAAHVGGLIGGAFIGYRITPRFVLASEPG